MPDLIDQRSSSYDCGAASPLVHMSLPGEDRETTMSLHAGICPAVRTGTERIFRALKRKGVPITKALAATLGALLLSCLLVGVDEKTANAGAASCPDNGWACFYHDPNFNNFIGAIQPGAASHLPDGVASIRNRTNYTVCLGNPGNKAHTSQAAHTQAEDIGGGWRDVQPAVWFADP
jgi:hypothetical protein